MIDGTKSVELTGMQRAVALLYVERFGYPRLIEAAEAQSASWFRLGDGIWWANHRGETTARHELCFHAFIPPGTSGRAYLARAFLRDVTSFATALEYDRLRVLRPVEPHVQSLMERLIKLQAWKRDCDGSYVDLKESRDGLTTQDPQITLPPTG